MKSLREIHLNKTSKLSDKWNIYLDIYDRELKEYRSKNISLLEIGVQNGGSLDTWIDFFPKCKNIVGCDINSDVLKLEYEDPRVKIFNKDATNLEELLEVCDYSSYDIILDDGSHKSGDIIKTFCHLFPKLNNEGCFIIEDLHCSYWKEFDGGIYAPYSSMGFLKKLSDIINHEHWGVESCRTSILEHELSLFNVDIDELELCKIHSIVFYNSVCIIRKKMEEQNVLGGRIPSGEDELVVSGHLSLVDEKIFVPEQINNPWNNIKESPCSKYFERLDEINLLTKRVEDEKKHIKQLECKVVDTFSKIKEKENEIGEVFEKLEEKGKEIANKNIELDRLYHIENSRVWKSTGMLRKQLTNIKKVKHILSKVPEVAHKKGGVIALIRHVYNVYKIHKLSGLKQIIKGYVLSGNEIISDNEDIDFLFKVSKKSEDLFNLVVTIIAELSIPQCEKYRVEQKKEMFESLGYQCNVVSWTDYFKSKELISLSSLVIFYRVPAADTVVSLIGECNRLKIKTYWEVDDLIFNRDILSASKTIISLDKNIQQQLLDGADLYLDAMLKCDAAIASTEGLAMAMSDVGAKDIYVVENALDNETLNTANHILLTKNNDIDTVRIVYGSGTSTHNIDFQESAQAIFQVLMDNSNVIFRVIGILDLPSEFDVLKSQIERIEFCDYSEYLKYISECQISIAPLESFIFNDSKSNIKYLEASIVEVASVCSPVSAFSSIIDNGINGFLAKNNKEWYEALSLLVNDEVLRFKVAQTAKNSVLDRYLPKKIAENQLVPIIKNTFNKSVKKKLLSFNVFYKPRSFGGATIVAEEINELLEKYNDYDVFVITTISPRSYVNPYKVIRYELNGVTVFAIAIPPEEMDAYHNPKLLSVVNNIIELVTPDLAHIHCIQGLGIGVIDACIDNNVDYIITLHDAWWICPRQFMITSKGKYCNQYILDENKCKKCIGDNFEYTKRQYELSKRLKKAKLLLAPSQFFADLHNVNEVSDKKVICNKNGINLPLKMVSKSISNKIRFGYVGGNTPIKGIHLILEAFKNIKDNDVELIIVDNLINLGSRSFSECMVSDIPNCKIVPAYNQDSIDEFFSEIDVLLFPTQWKESFGLTVREAISRNVWVIATDAGGVVEDIVIDGNGYVIPFDSDSKMLLYYVNRYISKHREILKNSDKVDLPKDYIRTFEEQAIEIKSIISNL
ncbi:glycosyltransferase [Photobacterium carnosum]|uniref:glycosyltransferase n=1 Tax=Photobacterium carnosum TaxID=2023717 RepID=UPI001E5F2F23|nr:glycosyltransferase [Photobacterium carnosum]MCD9557547.1 glycosyltransferase [Photobacterium carnosum]